MGTMDSMPRKSTLGPSVVITVRVPSALGQKLKEAVNGGELGEWLRNQLRHAVGEPVDRDAGYDEGYRAGWTQASNNFKRALKQSA